MKQALILPLTVLMFFLLGCKSTKEYTDYCAPLSTANIQKITIEIRMDTLNVITITEQKAVLEFINDLNSSKVDGPWKGANWDKLILHYKNGDKVFSTNGKVFGLGASGIFYQLNDKYKHYWNN